MKKPTEHPNYFFGYGSLMYASGINRGMSHYYTEADVTPVCLHGYKRSFCAGYDELTFYGMYEDKDSWINGVIFPIYSLEDYNILLEDEGVYYTPPLYTLKDVQADIRFTYTQPIKMGRVVALISNEIDEKNGYMPEYYVRHVWDGIKYHGSAFAADFLRTGGVSTPQCVFDQRIKNPWGSGNLLGAKRLR